MSKKHKGNRGHVPKGNQSRFGPRPLQHEASPTPASAPASEQDPKHRLGNYAGTGEHPLEQPKGKQGPNR